VPSMVFSLSSSEPPYGSLSSIVDTMPAFVQWKGEKKRMSSKNTSHALGSFEPKSVFAGEIVPIHE
jgi:hypothetical protein